MSGHLFNNRTGIFSRRSHYRKMVLFYSVFTVAVIIISSSILISYFNGALTEEIRNSNLRLLTQIRVCSDAMLREGVQSLILEKFLVISRDRSTLDFFTSGKVDWNALSQFCDDLSTIANASDIIDSIYVYRLSDHTLVSSREGVRLSVTSAEEAWASRIHFQSIADALAAGEALWVNPLDNSGFWPYQPMISFVQPVPLISSNPLGCVMINIDETAFYRAIGSIYDDALGEFMAADPAGRIFMHSDRHTLMNPAGLDGYLGDVLSESEAFDIMEFDGEYLAVTRTRSTLNDWMYISVTPVAKLNEKVFLARLFAAATMLLVAVLALLGMRLITLRLYRPIRQLFKSSVERFNVPPGNDNEIAVIDRVIRNLSNKVDEMEDTLKSNRGIIRYKIAMDILNGALRDIGGINERLKVIGEKMPYRNFCVAVTELDGRGLEPLTPGQHEYILCRALEITEEFLRGCDRCAYLSVWVNSRRIASIVNFADDSVKTHFPTLIPLIIAEAGLGCNMAVSRRMDSVENAKTYYEQTEALLHYGFIYNYGNVFFQDIADSFEKNDRLFDFTRLDHITDLMKSCKTAAVKEEIDGIFNMIRDERFTYSHVRSILVRLIGVYGKVAEEQNLDIGAGMGKLSARLDEARSLDECQKWIMQLIDRYEENVAVRNKTIDADFIHRITSYICEHIDDQLSLNSVARSFRITPNYLSRIFKIGTGVNFSDFIMRKKLQKAKELLLLNQKMTVSEVAKKLGYFNTTYFISLFKKNFGITPARFRKNSLCEPVIR